MSNTLIHLDESDHDDEVARAWNELHRKRELTGDDYSELCDDSGEVWQYMGTVIPPRGLIVHQFRHRCATSRAPILAKKNHDGPDAPHYRVYINIPATDSATRALRAEHPELCSGCNRPLSLTRLPSTSRDRCAPCDEREYNRQRIIDRGDEYSDADPGL